MIKCVCDNPLCYKNCKNIDELINKRAIAHKVTEMLKDNDYYKIQKNGNYGISSLTNMWVVKLDKLGKPLK